MSNNRINSRERLQFISYMQVIGIILVVAGHSVHMYPDGAFGESLFIHSAIYSFHMPLFIFISGFLMMYSTFLRPGASPRSAGFVIKKFKRLMVPFFTLTLITFVPRSLMSSMSDEPMEMSFSALAMSFVEKDRMVIPFFWFLQASFILLIVNFFIINLGIKAKANLKIFILALLLASMALAFISADNLTWFSINRVLDLWFFFTLGCACCLWQEKFMSSVPWTQPWLFMVFFLAWICMVSLPENKFTSLVCAVFGILMTVSLSQILVKKEWRFLDHLSGANYLIFLTSWYCNVVCQQVLSHIVVLPWWVYSLMSLFSGIYIPWLGYRYIVNHPDSRWVRFTSFLLGQDIKKPTSH